MKIIRHVPLSAALHAAVDTLDPTSERDETNAAFSDWINAERDDLFLRSPNGWPARRSTLLNRPSVQIDVARMLVDDVPDTPAGQAWKAALVESIALTEADVDRPYDDCCYDTAAEEAAQQDLDALVDSLRDRSPLLAPVADALDNQTFVATATLGDITEARARLTKAGLIVGEKIVCDKHDDDCYGDDRALALWTHIDAIAPGTMSRIYGLLARIDADLPTSIGEDDNGRARLPHGRH